MPERPPGNTALDPVMQSVLEGFLSKLTSEFDLEGHRQMLLAVQPPREALPELRIENRAISYGDLTDIPVRIYWPPTEQQENLPIVVFYHGGGWVLGFADLDTHDMVARDHCVVADAIVVSVDYRLAPEHPYPAAVDDSWAALQWVGEHAVELGGDPTRIAVAGDSAGGNLSAVMTQLARDNGGPALVYQLLWYPATTADLTLPSALENSDAPTLKKFQMEAAYSLYAPDVDLSEPSRAPTTLAPANATDFSALPPAYIATTQCDLLRDDGYRYADLLSAAGVPVEFHNSQTLPHGYANFAPVVPAAAETTLLGLQALKAALKGR
ncbi:alpha/beta hydrolase [Nocardia sp. NBC_00565]|uniref:alpha/beta hydrolase n=1 Tax=Nocardia sp. NBC_00565 TaxID=2975993 RepID=UPI002E80430C|nr:alpha/beta hydrolase [Nocardia sp. NBC_00565]WUC06623.1 alpha/beta hydrolase [Nocardia sp. NBC_00565]